MKQIKWLSLPVLLFSILFAFYYDNLLLMMVMFSLSFYYLNWSKTEGKVIFALGLLLSMSLLYPNLLEVIIVFGFVFWIMLLKKYHNKMTHAYQEFVCIERDTDSLSGLYNNAYVKAYLEDRLKHVNDSPLSILMMDIDNFRKVNERFGHAYGDMIIKRIADLLKEIIEPTDVIGRYGGEEFIVVLNDGTLERSLLIAEAIKSQIEVMPVKEDVMLTMSIGIAFNQKDSAESLIKKADDQLMHAKKLGKAK